MKKSIDVPDFISKFEALIHYTKDNPDQAKKMEEAFFTILKTLPQKDEDFDIFSPAGAFFAVETIDEYGGTDLEWNLVSFLHHTILFAQKNNALDSMKFLATGLPRLFLSIQEIHQEARTINAKRASKPIPNEQ